MAVCTFFGHRDCPADIKPKLWAVLQDLVENHGVDQFYVGNHGEFDRMVRTALRELAQQYSHIDYAVVLAYLPQPNEDDDYSDTVFPEGIEMAPKRFAISWRNRWMLQRADIVVSYVTHDWGGAAQLVQQARRKEKHIISLA